MAIYTGSMIGWWDAIDGQAFAGTVPNNGDAITQWKNKTGFINTYTLTNDAGGYTASFDPRTIVVMNADEDINQENCLIVAHYR